MKKESLKSCRKYCTVIGTFLIIFATDLPTFWGNFSVYILSYLAKKGVEDATQLNTPWILSIFTVSFISGLMVAGPLSSRINRRPCIALAILCLNLGVFGSYFTLNVSMKTLIITIGAFYGFGFGLAEGAALQFLLEWTVSDTGGLVSMALSGPSSGAIVINEVVTLYVNPDNKNPNHRTGTMKFFFQDDVVDRVPNTFLILGSISLFTQVVGFCLLRGNKSFLENSHPKGTKTSDRSLEKDENSLLIDKSSRDISISEPKFKRIEFKNASNSTMNERSLEKDIVEKHYVSIEQSDNQNVKCRKEHLTSDSNTRSSEENSDGDTNFTPSRILRSRIFYSLLFLFAAGEASYIFLGNYYKAYGQLYIKDDHFLTMIGTTLAIVSTVVRPCWGFLLDHLGVKTSLVGIYGLLPLLFICLYFTPMINPWLYLVLNIMIGCAHYCLFPTFIAAVVEYFGKKHFNYNLGMSLTGALIMNLVSPPFYEMILDNIGWFSLFDGTAGLDTLGLILVVFTLPQ